MVDLESGEPVLDQGPFHVCRIVARCDQHQTVAAGVGRHLFGHEAVFRPSIDGTDWVSEEQACFRCPFSHPALHAALHRSVPDFRIEFPALTCLAEIDEVSDVVPVSVGIKGVRRDEALELRLEQSQIAFSDLPASRINKIAQCHVHRASTANSECSFEPLLSRCIDWILQAEVCKRVAQSECQTKLEWPTLSQRFTLSG